MKKVIAFSFAFILPLVLILPCFAVDYIDASNDGSIDYLDLPDPFSLRLGNTSSDVVFDIYTYRSSVTIHLPPRGYSIGYYVLSDGSWILYSAASTSTSSLSIDMTPYDAIRFTRVASSYNPLSFGPITFSSNLPTENKGLSVFYHLFRASGVNDDYASVGVIIISSIMILSLVIFIFKICFGRKR